MTEQNDEPIASKKVDVRVVISSLGNERRTVHFNQIDEDQAREIISTVHAAYNTVRSNSSLLLTGSDGVVVLANVDNAMFIEVHIA